MRWQIFHRLPWVCLCLFLLIPVVLGQNPAQVGTGAISGRVTIGKNPAPGILVVAQQDPPTGEPIILETNSGQAFTDGEGRYSIVGLKPGNYTVRPFAAGFVNADEIPVQFSEKTRPEKNVSLSEGEEVNDLDFTLMSGGIITGRITDTEGWPIIGKGVHLTIAGSKTRVVLWGSGHFSTDDRGIYRLYGVPPGQYYVGIGERSPDGRQGYPIPDDPQIPVTYYPGVPDTSQATAVEVSPAHETSGIDFKAARVLHGYSISGLMQEAESGAPVPSLRFLVSQLDEAGRQRGVFASGMAGVNGEFSQKELLPGKYRLDLGYQETSGFYADPLEFSIANQDLGGLILLVHPGNATLSGQVILEGIRAEDAIARMKSLELQVIVQMQSPSTVSQETRLAVDGSFTFHNLPPGRALCGLDSREFSLMRIEFNGPPGNYLRDGIPLEPGAKITNLRLYFIFGMGTLIGQVRTREGPLPPGIQCSIDATMVEGQQQFSNMTDASGRFRIEGLPPGECELSIHPWGPPSPGTNRALAYKEVRQRVTVFPGQEVSTQIVIELIPENTNEQAETEPDP